MVSVVPAARMGIGGNIYVVCSISIPLKGLCLQIGKSVKSVYFNEKHNCYAIRIRNKTMKETIMKVESTAGLAGNLFRKQEVTERLGVRLLFSPQTG